MACVMTEERANFEAVGKRAIADLWKYHNHPENFQSSKFSEGDIKVYTMKSDNPDCPEDIAKASISLEGTTLNHALALVLPWMPYRPQWDDLLARAKVLGEISPAMKIVHHVTKKKTPLSARDSVDVVSVDARNNGSTIILAARSVKMADMPELKGHVRTFQHLGGFVIQDCGEGKIGFELSGVNGRALSVEAQGSEGLLQLPHSAKSTIVYNRCNFYETQQPPPNQIDCTTTRCTSDENLHTTVATQSSQRFWIRMSARHIETQQRIHVPHSLLNHLQMCGRQWEINPRELMCIKKKNNPAVPCSTHSTHNVGELKSDERKLSKVEEIKKRGTSDGTSSQVLRTNKDKVTQLTNEKKKASVKKRFEVPKKVKKAEAKDPQYDTMHGLGSDNLFANDVGEKKKSLRQQNKVPKDDDDDADYVCLAEMKDDDF
ncbi:unnamed protein product, partial [Mesorhabditis belari]|uniref:START domain-containing protein n=1 Tax=Mesorhabditis belari TaxID=2138241 RepID=A0AAF3FNK0_9BILA